MTGNERKSVKRYTENLIKRCKKKNRLKRNIKCNKIVDKISLKQKNGLIVKN